MALQLDSLVTDLIFQATAAIDQKALIDGLGGPESLGTKQLLDVDRLDPRAEMELSPSMPFRRRGERRLMLIDDQAITPRADPQADPWIKSDLRPAKEALISICQKLPMRLGRLFALGSWGDAVVVARNVRDLRAICLLPWALDPQIDVDGKRRATPLSQKEFEAKIMAYEKRLEELDDQQIIANLTGVSFERRGDLVVVDVLEPDGTWDQRKSMAMETQLAAIDRFSLIPGAPAQPKVSERPTKSIRPPTDGGATKAAPPPPAKPEPKPEPTGPPIAAKELDGKVVLVFPAERFDLDVAAALGKRDWDQVVRRSDNLGGAMRDQIHRDGAGWIAPLEFLSEVFVEGRPLTKAEFEKAATTSNGVRSMDVHFPRFGPVTLLEIAGKGRFVTSLDSAERAAQLVK
jgi:cell division septation protein DedD